MFLAVVPLIHKLHPAIISHRSALLGGPLTKEGRMVRQTEKNDRKADKPKHRQMITKMNTKTDRQMDRQTYRETH